MNDKYKTDECGIIHQVDYEKFNYNNEYIDTYRNFGSSQDMLSHLRLGYLMGAMKRKPESIIDIGYGDGNFLRACLKAGIESYGADITGVKVPEGAHFVEDFIGCGKSFDVISFFDSLEHFENIDFVSSLNVNYLIISVPCVPTRDITSSKFINWRHRKPNEHLHHFDSMSLRSFMLKKGYSFKTLSNPEDMIRRDDNADINIITGVFQKGDSWNG
jgi:hypothetical protein